MIRPNSKRKTLKPATSHPFHVSLGLCGLPPDLWYLCSTWHLPGPVALLCAAFLIKFHLPGISIILQLPLSFHLRATLHFQWFLTRKPPLVTCCLACSTFKNSTESFYDPTSVEFSIFMPSTTLMVPESYHSLIIIHASLNSGCWL